MVAGIQKNVESGYCRSVKRLVAEKTKTKVAVIDPRDMPREICTPLCKHCVEEEWHLALKRLQTNPEEVRLCEVYVTK